MCRNAIEQLTPENLSIISSAEADGQLTLHDLSPKGGDCHPLLHSSYRFRRPFAMTSGQMLLDDFHSWDLFEYFDCHDIRTFG